MSSYCISCKKNTGSKNEKKSVSSNGRNMLKGNCSVCNGKKCKFVAGTNKKGGMFGREQMTEFNEDSYKKNKGPVYGRLDYNNIKPLPPKKQKIDVSNFKDDRTYGRWIKPM